MKIKKLFISKEWATNLAAIASYEEEEGEDVDWGGRGWCWDGFDRFVFVFDRSAISPFLLVFQSRIWTQKCTFVGLLALGLGNNHQKTCAGVALLGRRTVLTMRRGRAAWPTPTVTALRWRKNLVMASMQSNFFDSLTCYCWGVKMLFFFTSASWCVQLICAGQLQRGGDGQGWDAGEGSRCCSSLKCSPFSPFFKIWYTLGCCSSLKCSPPRFVVRWLAGWWVGSRAPGGSCPWETCVWWQG